MEKFILQEYFDKFELNEQNRMYTVFFVQYISQEMFNGKDFCAEDFSFLTTDVLINSMTRYMKEKKATARKTAEQYIGCLIQFFKNLEDHYQVKSDIYVNGNFIPKVRDEILVAWSFYTEESSCDSEIASDEMYNAVDQKINELEKDYCFEIAVEEFNDYLISKSLNKLSKFAIIRSICATRLVLDFGFTNKIISNIQFDDVDTENGTIRRGRYVLKLSDRLKNYFIEYFRIRRHILQSLQQSSTILFIDHNGKQISNTQVGGKLLSKTISAVISGKNGSQPFALRVIRQLVIDGFNAETIEEITGYPSGTYLKICKIVNNNYSTQIQSKLLEVPKPSCGKFETRNSEYICCPLCGKKVHTASREFVLIKYLEDSNLYLRCKQCGEKAKRGETSE